MDINEALEAGRDILDRWVAWMEWPDSPPFSGGMLDSWPARLADGLALCRREWAAIQAFLKEEHRG